MKGSTDERKKNIGLTRVVRVIVIYFTHHNAPGMSGSQEFSEVEGRKSKVALTPKVTEFRRSSQRISSASFLRVTLCNSISQNSELLGFGSVLCCSPTSMRKLDGDFKLFIIFFSYHHLWVFPLFIYVAHFLF